jgi:hypothetical protein
MAKEYRCMNTQLIGVGRSVQSVVEVEVPEAYFAMQGVSPRREVY